MKKAAYVIFSILAMLLLNACSLFKPYEEGIYVSQAQMEKFENGKTKQSDVVAAIGNPNNKSQIANGEAWHYDYTKISHFGQNINELSVFEFDAKGILTNHYKTNQRNTKSGNPLLNRK